MSSFRKPVTVTRAGNRQFVASWKTTLVDGDTESVIGYVNLPNYAYSASARTLYGGIEMSDTVQVIENADPAGYFSTPSISLPDAWERIYCKSYPQNDLVETLIGWLTPELRAEGDYSKAVITALDYSGPYPQVLQVSSPGLVEARGEITALQASGSSEFEIVCPVATFKLYASESDRDSWESGGQVAGANFDPTSPTPIDIEVESLGTARFVSVPSSASLYKFSLRANGEDEGEEGGEFTIQASVQPYRPGVADTAAALTQGKKAYKLFTDTLLNSVEDGQADSMVIDGKTCEVVSCELWDNGVIPHYAVIVVANNPVAT